MSTLGHVQCIRGYHYECGRIPCVPSEDVQYIGEISSVPCHLGAFKGRNGKEYMFSIK